MDPILLIVFLPLLASVIAGLGNRALGNTVAKSLTTGALFIACGLSWPIFLGFFGGHAEAHVVPVLQWVQSGSLSFDWALLSGRRFSRPWLLAGGLTPENLAEAVRRTGAPMVDVSSGVEDRPGEKNPSKIKAFLDAAKRL